MDLESSETQLAEYQDNLNIEILETSRENDLNVTFTVSVTLASSSSGVRAPWRLVLLFLKDIFTSYIEKDNVYMDVTTLKYHIHN